MAASLEFVVFWVDEEDELIELSWFSWSLSWPLDAWLLADWFAPISLLGVAGAAASSCCLFV